MSSVVGQPIIVDPPVVCEFGNRPTGLRFLDFLLMTCYVIVFLHYLGCLGQLACFFFLYVRRRERDRERDRLRRFDPKRAVLRWAEWRFAEWRLAE